MAGSRLEIVEVDEAGNTTATYITNEGSAGKKPDPSSRVDVILPQDPKSLWQKGLDVFLPAGYPQSVTEDYMAYQIYDSLQAFSSSIAGLLSGRAVLQGVGVGDASATPTAALLYTVLQESAGRLATILFAYRLGTALEPECKMYRLAADIFNDAAMILDCLSPVFPKPIRIAILSSSSILRALCGVAAGSSKASLSAHFAKWGNLGELNAKDSSQETVISLIGMLAGSMVVSSISSPLATWSTLLFLLGVHISMNHAAVRSVSMRSLNRQRANIVFSHLLAYDKMLTPQQVSRRERIFERSGVLRWADDHMVGHGKIGVSLGDLIRSLGGSGATLTELLDLYADEAYILWFDPHSSTAHIVLKQGCTPEQQLKAWCQGLLLAKKTSEAGSSTEGAETLREITRVFSEYSRRLRVAGWDLNSAALETRSGTRVKV
ncbi:DUF647-domain-containing protein [Trichodelitschia bisporula]|uniref:DUF647-domain-containing protein n=1 Tax=Trichodelitschia bisporula TaxID=703511 RepID=A0A6G1HTH8_9PEZI|nr:DUF647-domain-containing protein [Trichodelitschia bisporula]